LSVERENAEYGGESFNHHASAGGGQAGIETVLNQAVEPQKAAESHLPTKGVRFTYIDALRGIAALLVMVHHFIFGHLNDAAVHGLVADAVRSLASYGDLGVEIFFVLSGFVISYSVRNARVTPRFFAAFALRRSIRLDPPYWLVIIASYLLLRLATGPVGAKSGFPEWEVLALNFSYLNRLTNAPTLVAVGWTMCQEIQFYLVFVFLLGLVQRIARTPKSDSYAKGLVFWPLAAYSMAIALSIVPTPLANSFFELWHLFFAGVCVSWSVFGGMPKAWAWLFVLFLGGVGSVYNDLRMVVGAATAASILIVAWQGRLTTLLNVGILQYFGSISYSLYLIHPLVGNRFLRFAMKWTGNSPSLSVAVFLFVVASLSSILAAHLIYRFVERPSQALAKRIKLPTGSSS
jgi:peptidoglycan/LPS O-acetylase OafA/YrhL